MSNIDEKAKNNFTIEMRIFENYEKVKHEIIKAIDFLRHSETPMGMCKIFDSRLFGYWFPPYKKYIPHRLRVLRLALKDLERIKEEYGKD